MKKRPHQSPQCGEPKNLNRHRIANHEDTRVPPKQHQQSDHADGKAKSCIVFPMTENPQLSDDDTEELLQIQTQVNNLKTKLDQVQSRKRDAKANEK